MNARLQAVPRALRALLFILAILLVAQSIAAIPYACLECTIDGNEMALCILDFSGWGFHQCFGTEICPGGGGLWDDCFPHCWVTDPCDLV